MATSRAIRALAVCGVLLTACMLPAGLSAAQPPPPPAPPGPPARIVVTGEGSVTVPADYAEIVSGVTTRARTAEAATAANSKLMTAVDAALRNAGIAQSDIQTARFSVAPFYTSPPPNGAPKLAGYSVSNEVRVKVRQI